MARSPENSEQPPPPPPSPPQQPLDKTSHDRPHFDSVHWSTEEIAALRHEVMQEGTIEQSLLPGDDAPLSPYQVERLCAGEGTGLVLGNYVIVSKLGQGGMGVVFKARHQRMDRLVAIKILSPQLVRSPEQLARFHREVQAAARLEHPHIVTAHDADEARGMHFLVMQLVDGADLSSIVETNGPLTVDQAIDCLIQAAQGLEYAHRQKVIHRDIKPANLLLDKEGTVKILDMGLARIGGSSGPGGAVASLTDVGAVMGTVDYMSPEQAADMRTADARSDIYSLGATLWYLLVGRPIYSGTSVMARLVAHRQSPIPSLKGTRGDVPPAVDALFQKMVAKKADDRYQSMGDVLRALKDTAATREQGSQHPLIELTRSMDTVRLANLNRPDTRIEGDSGRRTPLQLTSAARAARIQARRSTARRRSLVQVLLILVACVAAAIKIWGLPAALRPGGANPGGTSPANAPAAASPKGGSRAEK